MNVSNENLIQKECILGVNSTIGCVELIDDRSVLYSCGKHVLIWCIHTKKQVFLHQCKFSESLKGIVLCPNRKTIAVNITGKDGPRTILYDALTFKRNRVFHHGEDISNIIGLSFSRDSKQCILLGDAPTYVMSMWNIEKVPRMMANIRLAIPSGKCICHVGISPIDKKVVCVSGNRILRFFKLLDNAFRPITVNLQRELQNYLHHCWLPSGHMVLGTADNELLVVENFEAKVVVPLEDWNDSISAMIPFSKGLIIGGNRGSLRVYISSIEERNFLILAKELGVEGSDMSAITSIATSPTEGFLACLMRESRICSFPLSNTYISSDDGTTDENIVPRFHSPNIDGINQIICLDVCLWKPIIATGGGDQTLRIWDYKERKFELVYDCKSEIISISLHPSSMQILICCKDHVRLDYVQHKTLSTIWHHAISTNGTSCFSNGGQYFALGIGPFVQVYETYSQDPICTLRGHSSTLKAITWKERDEQLGTIGADGVICIWNIPTGIRLFRHVNATCVYISGHFNRDFSSVLLNTSQTSTIFDMTNSPIDLVVREKKVDQITPSSEIIISHENVLDLADSSFGIALFAKSLCRENIIFGAVNNEHRSGQICIKSPSYEGTEDTFLKVTLHSRAITCIRISPDQKYLFTGSKDGSVCIVKLHDRLMGHQHIRNNENELGIITFPDILISQAEMEEKDENIRSLRRKGHEIERQNKIEMKEIDYKHVGDTLKLTNDLQMKLESISRKCEEEELSLIKLKGEVAQKLSEQEKYQSMRLADTKRVNDTKLAAGKLRIEQFEADCIEQENKWNEEKQSLDKKNQEKRATISSTFDDEMQNEMNATNKLLKEKGEICSKQECCIELIEEDADTEIASGTQSHEIAIQNERKITLRIMEETDILTNKYAASMKDYEEYKDTIASLEEKQTELTNHVKGIKKETTEYEHDMCVQENDIALLDHQIIEVTKENNEMEKSRFMQSKKIQELKREIKPKEEALQETTGSINELEIELQQASQKNENLRVTLLNLKLKLDSMNMEFKTQSTQMRIKAEEMVSLEQKMHNISKHIGDKDELKRSVIAVYHEYVLKEKIKAIPSNNIPGNSSEMKSESSQYVIESLKKKIKGTEVIIERDRKQHTTNMCRLKRENKILQMQIDELDCEAKSMQVEQVTIVDSATNRKYNKLQTPTEPLTKKDYKGL